MGLNPNFTMHDIVNALRTDIAIAHWDAARDILRMHDGHVAHAKLTLNDYIDHGLSKADEQHLSYLIDMLEHDRVRASAG